MKRFVTIVFLAILLTLPLPAQRSGITAFVDVTIIPMDVEQVLRNQTVLVQSGRITAIGPTPRTLIPSGAQRINGAGKYLMPGLADMHVHFLEAFNPLNGEPWDAAEEINRAQRILYIANGVTTVRNMWGGPLHLELRNRIAAGKLIGPTIFTAGTVIDGSPPVWMHTREIKNPEQAKAAVEEDKRNGYDAVKVYENLTLENYSAVVAAARERNLPVYGHIPRAVGLLKALEAKQNSIEHLSNYIPALRRGNTSMPAIDDIDETKIPEIVRKSREAGTWNCVTLVVNQNFVSVADAEKLRLKPSMKYVPPALLKIWDPSTDFRLKSVTAQGFAQGRRRDAFYLRLTKSLYDGGARLLIGTDTPNPFVVPGFSLHEELQNFVSAGLTPFQTLSIATGDAAVFLGQQREFGTVAVGKRADLLLLEGNPLDDIKNVQERVGVMVRGRWFPEKELQSLLNDLIAGFRLHRHFVRCPISKINELFRMSQCKARIVHHLYWTVTNAFVTRIRRGGGVVVKQGLRHRAIFQDRSGPTTIPNSLEFPIPVR